MEQFFQKSSELKKQRKAFKEKYESTIQEKKENVEGDLETFKKKIYNIPPMTFEELKEYGSSLDKQYHNVMKTYNYKKYVYPPYELNRLAFKKELPYFISHDGTYKDCNGTLFDDEERSRRKYNKLRKNIRRESLDPAINCKNFYYESLKVINSHNILIYGLEKDLSEFKNREASSICGGCTPFIFYCSKNNYRFRIQAIDDCDCDPGLLLVDGVENTNTGENYKIYCDLFCQNTFFLGNY